MQVIQKIARQIKFLLHRSLISGSSDPGSGNRLRCSRNTYIKNQRNIRIIGSVSLVLLLTLTAFTLRPVSVSTDFAEATANPATTTLTVETSGNAAILDITPSSTSGTFSSSDTTDTSLAFNVSTNNITGYNLSISHGSSTTPAPLTSEDLSEDLDSLPTGTSITESQFNSTEYVGHYGYKPSKLNSADNSNYIPAPTVTATTLNVTSQANTTGASDNYTIALGANIDYTKSAGTYTNTFILTAVANNVAYTINYKDTSGYGVSNLPATESASTATASRFILSSTIPTRTGYTFNKWCDGTVTYNATGNDTCSGTTYSAGSTYSFANPSSTSTNVANLYAMWNVKTYSLAITFAGTGVSSVKVCKTAGNCSGTNLMGTVSSSGGSVSGLTYNTKYYLYPTFSSSYTLDSWSKTSSTGTLSSTTSTNPTFTMGAGNGAVKITGKTSLPDLSIQDVTSSTCTTTAQDVYDKRDNQVYKIQKLADGKCWLLDNLRLGSADFASGVTTLDSTNTNTTNSIATSTFTGWNKTSGFTSYTAPMINTTSANNTTTSYGSGSGKIGVYYNYCAATMQSYCYGSGTGTGNASEDVCPAGWRMPTGGPNGEYQALYTAYSSNATNFRNALSTPLSGHFLNRSADVQGSVGYFWSSTYSSDNYMYFLYVDSSDVGPQNSYDRLYGIPVRCVLKSGTIADATNMQTVTSAEIANSAEGETTTLKDIRDNQDYTVAKINGNLWMTRNLAIGCNGSSRNTVTLTSSDSNVSSDYAISSSTVPDFNSSNNSPTSGYTTAAMMCSSNSSYGAWYNYKAATAGTITGSSNNTNATNDICPAGWRLPTATEQSGITGYKTTFSPVTGNYYDSGSPVNTWYGYWWSATASNSARRYFLYWRSSGLDTSNTNRYNGFYVRCIRSS